MPSSHMWSSRGGTASPVSRAKGQATFPQVRTFENPEVPAGLLLPDRAFTLGRNVTGVDGALNRSHQLTHTLGQVPQLLLVSLCIRKPFFSSLPLFGSLFPWLGTFGFVC